MAKAYNPNTSLLGATSRIEAPFICVKIGSFTFGVYQKTPAEVTDQGVYMASKVIYPNYVKSLKVEKINGQVNQYTLSLIYPITPGSDPNFFEKVFSSASRTKGNIKARTIYFTYGDASMPTYVYKKEEALITDIRSTFDLASGSISYTVSAVSSAKLGFSGIYSFPTYHDKPSRIIRDVLLSNSYYGLKDLFYGMSNLDVVDSLGLIPSVDAVVNIDAKDNISALDYLKYLVSCMIPGSADLNSNQQDTFFVLTIHDEVIGETINDTKVETLGGPYFQIDSVSSNVEHADAYEIDIGYPSQNIVMSFSINDNENYSIYYDWQSNINSEEYVMRINDNGEWQQEYSPVISSGNAEYTTRASDKVWWTKITQYPISASITIKGLLRPATLMQYVKLNVFFFGKKHISSGTYIVTKQTDMIDRSGYRTTLDLTRVQGESEDEYDS